MSLPQIYLASSSPRRRELLDQLGMRYAVLATDVDETVQAGEGAEEHVIRLALAKAAAGWARVAGAGIPVLGADTVVVQNNQIMGKPANQAQGLAMLRRLSGHTHRVLTAVAVVRGELRRVLVSSSEVSFRKLRDSECIAYWETGEPWDKAGGYAIQGLGGLFVCRLVGSYSGVMGLPLYETGTLLQDFSVAPAWLDGPPR